MNRQFEIVETYSEDFYTNLEAQGGATKGWSLYFAYTDNLISETKWGLFGHYPTHAGMVEERRKIQRWVMKSERRFIRSMCWNMEFPIPEAVGGLRVGE